MINYTGKLRLGHRVEDRPKVMANTPGSWNHVGYCVIGQIDYTVLSSTDGLLYGVCCPKNSQWNHCVKLFRKE